MWVNRETVNRKGKYTDRNMWVELDDFNPKTDIDLMSINKPTFNYEEVISRPMPFKWEYIGVIENEYA
jgi:hypothetical protein